MESKVIGDTETMSLRPSHRTQEKPKLLLNRSVEPTEPIRNDRGHLLPVRSPTREGLKMRDDSLSLRTIHDVRELESMRGIWERWPGSRDSDLDFFWSMVRSRGSNCRPHVIVLSRNARPDAILIGLCERRKLRFRLGSFTICQPEVNVLELVYGGRRGNA